MKIEFDKKADALYIKLKRGKIHKTIAHDGFIVDTNKKGEVMGIEVLNYSKTTASEPDKHYVSLSKGAKVSLVSV